MSSNHLILCHPLLLLPLIFPSIRVFSNESALCIRWPKYWSFSFNITPSNEHSALISFRMDWLDLLEVQGTLVLNVSQLSVPKLINSSYPNSKEIKPVKPKEINSEYSLKGWCWSWSSNTLATWCTEPSHWKRSWCWERLRVGGEGGYRGWDGWLASPTQWTW